MPGKRFKNIQNFRDDTTVVASFNTESINIQGIDNFSIQQIFTVTTASFVNVIQVSNDNVAFFNIGPPLVIGASGSNLVNFGNRADNFLRVQILRVSGTLDTFKIHIHLKSNH